MKPNFNSADPTPGSTHDDVLRTLVQALQDMDAGRITIGDRSGHFTLSLKNSVGLVAKQVPGEAHDYMGELHGSRHQRLMIAEINVAYQPDLIVLDGVEAFVDRGPDRGKRVDAEVVLAGIDRVAVDAVGVAILRYWGTTPDVRRGPIFQQEQIARAVELGLGVETPEQIALITDDPQSAAYAEEIQQILRMRS